MIGFEIKFKEQILLLPPEAVITITERNGEGASIYAGAYNPDNKEDITWIQSELVLYDEIHINIKNVEKITDPVRVSNYFEDINSSKEDFNQKALKRFLILKQELLDAGLISE